MLYKVYVSKKNGEYKLINYFDYAKQSMKLVETNNINFYFSEGIKPNKKKIRELIKFYSYFTNKYIIPQTHKITIVVSRSIDEAWESLGVPYTVYRSEDPNAGISLNHSIILTTRENHTHELVHAILTPINPNIPQWLNEGIATYYGGVGGKEFNDYIEQFRTHIEKYGDKDIFDREFLYSQIAPNISAQYILGALIVDYTIRTYGDEMLSDIFHCTDTKQILQLLGINQNDSYKWIVKQLYN